MSDLQEPVQRYSSTSLPGQLTEVEVSGCISRTTLVEPEDLHLLNEAKSAMRNNFSPAIRRAKERTGGEYRMEISEMIMPSGGVYVVGIITRLS
jgi:hypothetical protein